MTNIDTEKADKTLENDVSCSLIFSYFHPLFPGISLDFLGLLNSLNAILLPNGLVNLSKEELLKIILYGHE